ncbi:thioredoxin family protein [Lutibacter citreus]|uniref:thioredoxin family protein n=1 Tax=Lutibacter citreus TaxID=2138210 RepID=UPI0013006CFF|nr:thioredoxin family protein [Lutibacter citreus]
MKKVIFSCVFTIGIFFQAIGQDSFKENNIEDNIEVNWEKDYSKAVKLSKSSKKPLLIFFTGSDWCSPCKMLVADVFQSKKFKNLSEDDFVLYEANYPRNKDLVSKSQKSNNESLKRKFNINTYPTVIIVNSKEHELGRLKGYNLMRDTSYHYSFFKETLNK